ncbi:hypothetical protein OIDMADRAFT_16828, partial [Oidiodendron maius Zn]
MGRCQGAASEAMQLAFSLCPGTITLRCEILPVSTVVTSDLRKFYILGLFKYPQQLRDLLTRRGASQMRQVHKNDGKGGRQIDGLGIVPRYSPE